MLECLLIDKIAITLIFNINPLYLKNKSLLFSGAKKNALPSQPDDMLPSFENMLPLMVQMMPSFVNMVPSMGDVAPSIVNMVPSMGVLVPSVEDMMPSMGGMMISFGEDMPSITKDEVTPPPSEDPQTKTKKEEPTKVSRRSGGSDSRATVNAWFPIHLGYPTSSGTTRNSEPAEAPVAAIANSVSYGSRSVANSQAVAFVGQQPQYRNQQRAYQQ